MVETAKTLKCVVVTPERTVLDESCDFVVVPMFDGELGVLAHHAPLIGRLGKGALRLKKGSTTRKLTVEGGFAQIRNNVVTVLTAKASALE